MKKTLTLLIAVLFTVLLNAQKNQPKSLIFSEDFSENVLPDDWKNIDNSSDNAGVWFFDNPGNVEINTKTAENGIAIFDSDFIGNDGKPEDSDLITNSFDCTGKTSVFLKFEHYFKDGYGGACEVFISGNDGSTWTLLDSWADATTTNAEVVKYNISEYAANKANVKIKWNWKGDFSYYWAIDDIEVYEPDPHDLSVIGIAPDILFFGTDTVPSVTIKNVGLSTENDFTVDILITHVNSTIYTSTKSVTGAGLEAEQETIVIMDDIWPAPAKGEYTIQALVTLANDGNHNNDKLVNTCTAIDFSYTNSTVYGYVTYDAASSMQYYIVSLNTDDGALTDLKLSTTSSFITCGDFVNGIIVAVEYGSKNLFYINGDGSCYEAGNLQNMASVTGIAYDSKNEQLYVSEWYDFDTASYLYTVSKDFSIVTKVGKLGNFVDAGIACDTLGNLYGIMTNNFSDPDQGSTFYSINKTTGEATIIGSLDIPISFIQDIGCDKGTNKIYGTLYQGMSVGGLYEISKETGKATLIETFPYEISMCAVTPTPSGGSSINNKLINKIRIMPNPTNGTVNIYANQNYTVEVIDITGRIISTTQMNNMFVSVDISNQQNGLYIIRLSNNNGVTTYKIIKE